MAKKEFSFYGKKEDELKQMSMKEFAALLPSKYRRSLARGLTKAEEQLMKKVEKNHRNIKTHARSMVVLPSMIGKTIKVYSGKEFIALSITKDMIGHRLGEYALTRNNVKHGTPGIGASRSSSSMSVK